MSADLDPSEIAASLMGGVGALLRRVQKLPHAGGLTMPERTALALLDRSGPTTSSALAREVQITAQAMGATLAGLRDRGLIARDPDPDDGRRMVLTVTDAGRRALEDKRNARTEVIAVALTGGAFTSAELEQLAAAAPLLDRLAQNL